LGIKKAGAASFQPLQLVFQDFIRHRAVLGLAVHADRRHILLVFHTGIGDPCLGRFRCRISGFRFRFFALRLTFRAESVENGFAHEPGRELPHGVPQLEGLLLFFLAAFFAFISAFLLIRIIPFRVFRLFIRLRLVLKENA
jgi:hypothetical protein